MARLVLTFIHAAVVVPAVSVHGRQVPRNRPTMIWNLAFIAILLVLGSMAVVLAEENSQFASVFPVDKANLVTSGRNPYFILEPGYRFQFKAEDAALVVTVLDETKTVDGVETRVIEERETESGELIEVSRNYFAIDKTTNDVYYFGEDVDIYEDGKVVGHEGAWWSGVDGAKFGMMMPGKPKVGDKFYQEFAPKVAMDRCEVVGVSEAIKTPAGDFTDCLRTKETSPLESGGSVKIYAPGVGMVRDDEFLLVKVERPTKAARHGWTSLFNGKNLDGWVVKCLPQDNDKRGYWKVVDGTITAETPPDSKHNYIWLLTEKEYGDFELRMKVQTYASSTGNSGIQVRSRYDDEAGWLDGPQVDINPPGPWRCGFIYDETREAKVWLWPDVGSLPMPSRNMPPKAGNGFTPTTRTFGTMSTSSAKGHGSRRS